MDIITYAAAVKRAKKLINEHIHDLPIATEESLGAVMIGEGLNVTNSGTV